MEHDVDGVTYAAIRFGVREAVKKRTGIDDITARCIAEVLHTGPDSAMYSLASTGSIDERLVIEEILNELAKGRLDGEERDAVRHLGLYVLRCGNRPSQEGWADVWV